MRKLYFSFLLLCLAFGATAQVTKTVGGTGADYATLKEAIDSINSGAITGAITLNITGNTTETATSVLNSSGAGPASYTSLLIQPFADGLSVSGATVAGRGLIELNGADNVTINGDNPNSPGINRNLSIINTAANTLNYTSVIRIGAMSTVITSADNNTIKNLIIRGSGTGRNIATATSTSGPESTTYGILAGSRGTAATNTTAPTAVTSVSTTLASGGTLANLVIENNDINAAGRAISIQGSNVSVAPNAIIRNNLIGNPVVGSPDAVYAFAIQLSGVSAGLVTGNTIYREGYRAAASHSINIGDVSTANANIMVEGNFLLYGKSSNANAYGSYGIALAGGNGHTVRNNFIARLFNEVGTSAAFNTTDGVFGIRISSGNSHTIVHNSIHLTDNLVGTNSALTTALGITSTTNTGMNIRNNIFSNVSTSTSTASAHVALYFPSTVTSSLNLTLNNNAYFQGTSPTSGIAQVGTTAGTGFYIADNFNPFSTAGASNLRNFTSGLGNTTNDSASFATSSPAPFISATDLHINPSIPTQIESGGAPLGVTLDIDAQTRNASTPDIGADEGTFTPVPPIDITVLALSVPGSAGCENGSQPISVVIKNVGSAPLNLATNPVTISTTVSGAGSGTYTATLNTGTLAVGASTTVTLTPTLNFVAPGTYTFTINATTTGDTNTSNDNLTETSTITAPIVLPVTVDFTGFTGSNLNAVFPNWREASGAVNPTGTTSSWLSSTLFGDTTAKVNLFSNSKNEWIIGPKITATADTKLIFDAALTDFGNLDPFPDGMGTDDKVIIRVSTNCGATWTDVFTFDSTSASTMLTNVLTPQTISLGAFAGQNIIVAFFATEGTVNDPEDYDFHIDDIRIANVPACTGATGGSAMAGTAAFCGNGSTIVSASGFAATGSGATYQWQISSDNSNWADIAGQINPTSVPTGNLTDTAYYRLKVSCGTAIGYSNIVTVFVNPLPSTSVSASTSAMICSGQPVTLTATGNADTYSWSPSTGLNSATGSTVIATPAITTNYIVTGTFTATGCIMKDTVQVEVKTQTLVTASAAQDTICAGASVQLNSSAILMVNGMRITEVTVFRTGTGQTPTYPAYTPTAANDLVELSNLSAIPYDISGMTLSMYGDNTATASHTITFPVGTVVPANGVVVVHIGAGTDVPASLYFNTGGSSDSYSSTSKIGVVLRSGSTVIDAVGLGGTATGTYTFHASTGVTAADFSGAAPNASGLAGSIRTGATDTNTGADWTASSAANVQSIGTYNAGYTPISGGSFTYSWTPLTGLSNATIANPVASPTVTTTYILQVTETGTGCSVYDTLSITVKQLPSITTEPSALAVCSGASAQFTVVATGTDATYQWQFNGVNITGATDDTLSINSVGAAELGSYSVIVTNACGADTSVAAALTLSAPTAITTQPSAQALCLGSSASFTVAATGGGTLTYQWKKNGQVITGATASTYTIATITSGDAGSYTVDVTGACGTVTSAAATLVLNSATLITTEPSALTLCNGSAGTFSVVASGTNLSYQWQKDGVDIVGQTTANLSFTLASAANVGTYRVIVNGLCGADTSAAVALTITSAPSITTQPVTVTACAGGSASFSVAATGSGLTYQWRKAGANITGANSNTYSIAAVTAADAGTYDVVINSDCGTVTSNQVSLTINAPTVITAEPVASSVCAGTAANFSVTATAAGTITYQWRKNGVNITGATSSAFSIPTTVAADAANYSVIVSGTCGNDTSATVALTVKAAPSITTQPAAQTVCLTTQTTFSVAATGSGTLTYQWRKNGVNIAGAVANSYVIPGAQAGDAGNYDVVITGECGTVTSSVAALVVNTCTSLPNVDTDVTEVKLLPNIVNGSTVLRVKATRTMKTDWIIVDANGKTVMGFSRQLQSGTNDFRLFLGNLANGNYYLVGETGKGRIGAVRFTRL